MYCAGVIMIVVDSIKWCSFVKCISQLAFCWKCTFIGSLKGYKSCAAHFLCTLPTEPLQVLSALECKQTDDCNPCNIPTSRLVMQMECFDSLYLSITAVFIRASFTEASPSTATQATGGVQEGEVVDATKVAPFPR